MIGVEFSAWQAVESAEIQSTGEDSIRTATLPATEHRNIYCTLYFLFNDYMLNVICVICNNYNDYKLHKYYDGT